MCLTLLKVFGVFLTHITGNTVLREVWSHGLHITAFLYALAPCILSLMVIRSLPGDIMSVLPLLCLGCISLGERKISPFCLLPKNKNICIPRCFPPVSAAHITFTLTTQPGNYGNRIKERKECGWLPLPPPPAAHPCLSFMSVPFPYHPDSVVCIIGFVFSLFFFSSFPLFLLPCIQDYETLLWALPSLLLLLFTLVVCGWGGEGGPPNIYQPNSPKSPPLLLGNTTTTTKNGVMNMNSIVR